MGVISSLVHGYAFDQNPDRFGWFRDSSDVFFVASIREFLDNASLISNSNSTRWKNFAPIKLNILMCHICNIPK